MSGMSIAVVSPEFPPQIGGVERYAHEYTKALSQAGYRVTVFTRPHPEGEIEMEGVEIRPVLQRDYRRDRDALMSSRFDAWHVMNAAYAWVACETNQAVVVSVHGNDFLRPYLPLNRIDMPLPGALQPEWLKQKLARAGRERTRRKMVEGLEQASAILTNSEYTERVLLQHYPQLQGKTVVGLVGVSGHHLATKHVPREPEEPARLITISRLSEPRKNVHLVLDALAGLRDDYPFSYRIVGDGTERESLERLAISLGLGERVQFCGRLTEQELLNELSASDLFVLCSSILPTSHEGFGIVYLEANACGVPTLGARLAGAAEAIDEGNSGFFVDEPNVNSLRAALRRFFSGEIHFDSNTCRDFAAQFTWARVVEKAAPFYGQSR